MKRRVLVVLAVVLAGIVTGAAPAGAVTGGGPVTDGPWGFVAKVTVGADRACTGALVNPQWILTARSCFVSAGQPLVSGPPPLPTTVTLGRVDLSTEAGRVMTVVQIVPHIGRDVLLAKLALRVTEVAPIPVSATAPAAGDVVQAAGFGRTATEWVPDLLQSAPAQVGAVAADAFSWSGAGASTAAACKGDAGGPIVRAVGGGVELVGLSTTAEQGGCLGEPTAGGGATAARLDDLTGWIADNAVLPTTTFGQSYNSSAGIGGYPLTDNRDQIVPFDYDHSGKLDHLVVYRPGTGTVSILKRTPTGDQPYTVVFSSLTGIGGYDLKGAADRIIAFDYDRSGKLDHLLLYRPGARTAFILRHGSGNSFTPVYSSITAGIGGWDLADSRDQIVAFDYEHSGKQDYLLLYRPGLNQARILAHGSGNTFNSVYHAAGIGGYDMTSDADRIVPFDYDKSGKMDHLLLYRPGAKRASVVRHNAGNTFAAVYSNTQSGIGGYDLASSLDQVIAYDYEQTGKLDHLLLYRPGSGTVWILRHGSGNSFDPVFNSTTGVGGYNLADSRDRIVAFDKDHVGGLTHLLLYRPGGHTAWVVGRTTPNSGGAIVLRPVLDPRSLVEDFSYPGAESIDDIELIKGDGRIMMVNCTNDRDLIKVESLGLDYCFRVKGDTGWLRLRVEGVFLITSGDQTVTATFTANGEEQTAVIPEHEIAPIGTTDPDYAVLLELRATP